MIDETVSHYRIVSKLGEGGMGVVYEAEDLKLGRRVALKFLPSHLRANKAAKARFIHEAKAASALDHPNIGTIYEIDETPDGQMFIAMARYDGGTLRQKLESGPVAVDEAIDIFAQVTSGLAKAHDSGIVHRDIKPGNILLSTDGLVKVVDFGLAKLAGITRITRTGTTMGTVSYMSPEQAQGEEVEPSSDAFSLGVVFYELLAGKRPFRGSNDAAVIYSIINVDPDPLDRHRAALPAGLQGIIDKALAKDPESRYANAGEILRDLETLRDGRRTTSSPDGRTRTPLRVGLAVAALAAVVTIGSLKWGPMQRSRTPPAFVTERRIAVVPMENMTGHGADVLANGLSEAVSYFLEEMAWREASTWVVPYYKVSRTPIVEPRDAVGSFGVNQIVMGRMQRYGDSYRVTLQLCGASDLQEIRSVVLNFDGNTGLGLPDSLLQRVGKLVNVDAAALDPARRLQTERASAMIAYVVGLGWLQRYREVAPIDSALTYLERAVELDPNFAMAYVALGLAGLRGYWVTKEEGRLELAIDELEKAIELEPGLVYANLHCGQSYFYMQRYDEAIERLQKALAIVPGHPRASKTLARIYHRVQGRYDEALSIYNAAIRRFPDYWMTHFELGLFYYYSDEHEKAIAAWKDALKFAPNDVTTVNNIGASYHQAGQWESARQYFERSFQIRPACESCQNMGLTAYFDGNYDESTRYYEFALEYCDTTSYDTWGNLAAAMYFAEGRRAEAKVVFRTAIRHLKREFRVSPEKPDLIAAMITYHAMCGGAPTSPEMISYGDSVASDDPDVLFAIGDAYELFGERELGLRYVGSAIRHGYALSEVERTPNLAGLRSDPLFQQMIYATQSAADADR